MDFLDLFRPHGNMAFHVETRSNIAIDAGLASSASGFAALVMALNDLFGWALSRSQQSLLARLGSGSACRSFWPGFVEWDCGAQTDGQDSYAHPLKRTWEGLCLGICLTSTEKKAICSREAMNITVNTSSLYKSWPARVTEDMSALKKAIETKDFARFGEVAEENALAMHATMLDASPSINYTLEATHALQRAVWAARKNGLAVYFTQDAGPNLKLLYMEKDSAAVKDLFPEVQSHRLF